jgi:hypothetical protein
MVEFSFPDGKPHVTLGGLKVCKGLLRGAVEMSKWKFLFSDCEECT